MKKLAIGCGIAAVLCVVVIVGVIVALPKIAKNATGWFQSTMKEVADTAKFEANWKPPTEQPGSEWFPAEVGGWKRESAEAFAELPELKVTKEGYRALYVLNNQRIEVKAMTVSDLEMGGLRERAAGFTPRPENGSMRTSTSFGNVRQSKYGNGERLYVRTLGNTFLLLHTLDGAEIEPFANAWLHAIDQQPPEAPATGSKQ